MNRTLWLSLAVVFAFLAAATPLRAQAVLTTAPSPEANGRAAIYTSSETNDPLAAMSNPALLGFQAQRNHLMVGFYPERLRWRSYFRYSYSARALQFGFDQSTLQNYFHWNVPLSIGLGYHEAYQDLREPPNGPGNDFKHYHVYQRSQVTNLAAALHYSYVQVGVGLNYRTADLNSLPEYSYIDPSSGHPTSVDLGLYLQSPLDRLFYRNSPADQSQPTPLRPFCTVGFSYVLANDGRAVRNDDSWNYSNTTPQPRTAKMGLNAAAGLQMPHPSGQSWNILTAEMGIEAVDRLVTYQTDQRYQNPIGNIHPISTLLFGKADFGVVLRKGFEVGLGEAVYYRGGNVTGDTYMPETSDGFGIHLSGLLKTLTWKILPNNNTVNFVARHFDLQYEQSTQTYKTVPSWKDGITSRQLTLLWKY